MLDPHSGKRNSVFPALRTSSPGRRALIIPAVLLFAVSTHSFYATCYAAAPPNIIFVLADDLGYGDLGCFHQDTKPGPRFDTPAIDALAAGGMRLTHHYAASPVCAPSRASFLLGRHQGHCSLRGNVLTVPLEDNLNVARMLKSQGYYTAHLGKYGLAGKKKAKTHPGHPNLRGFDYFLGYLFHGDPSEHYPRNGTTDMNAFVYENFEKIEDAHADLYTPDLWTARAKKIIVDETEHNPERPFFLYLAYDTPHRKLQAPPAAYPAGGGIRGGLQWTGPPAYCNTAAGKPENIDAWIHPDLASQNWSADNKRHAAMIRRIDTAIGDIVQTLKDLGIAKNTLVVFTSDNGPHAEGGQNPRFFESYGHMDGIKRDLWEAGIRVPAVAWRPGMIAPGSETAFPSGLWDWMPTFADLAGAVPPASCDGVSLLPSLTGTGAQRDRGYLYFEFKGPRTTPNWIQFENSRRGRPRGEMQAVRIGDFMGVRTEVVSPKDRFEIYDVVRDPKETKNLDGTSSRFNRLQLNMQNMAMRVRRPGGNKVRPYDSAPLPAIGAPTQPGLTYRLYQGVWPWLPDFDALTESRSGVSENIDITGDAGIAYHGYISVPDEGTYTFFITSESGAYLWLHEARIIEDDYHHDGTVQTGRVNLKRGLHPFRLYARRASGNQPLRLRYTGPTLAKQPVADAAFFRDAPSDSTLFAFDDDESIRRGDSIRIDVIANDYHKDGLSHLHIARSGDPDHGTVTVEGGTVLYSSDASFVGEDEFTYEITDGSSSATATVSVAVYTFDPMAIHIPFDESGNFVASEAGGSKLGALHGFTGPSSSWTEGRAGNALLFDGLARWVELDPLYVPPLGGEDRTVSCWIKTTTGGIITVWGDPKGMRYKKWHWRIDDSHGGTGVMRLQVQGAFVMGSTDLRDYAWHHIAVVYKNGGSSDIMDCRFFIDGMPEPFSSSRPGTVDTSASSVLIGGSNNRPSFKGLIDDFRIYHRALSDQEIARQYADAAAGGNAETNVTVVDPSRVFDLADPPKRSESAPPNM